MKYTTIEVGSEYYHTILDLLEPSKRAFVDEVVRADHYFLVFDGEPVGGFTINKSGEVKGIFSSVRGLGRTLLEAQEETQLSLYPDVKRQYLNCLGDYLKDYYETFGFVTVESIPFNHELAPRKWDYDKYGTPDLYLMERYIGD